MKTRIDYKYAHFEFHWTFIKDKIIIHQGGEDIGMLMIANEEGKIIRMYGYELITNERDDRDNKE